MATTASFRSVPELFLHRIASTPDSDAFYKPVGDAWKAITWAEVGERVKNIAGGLCSLGLEPEQRVAILSSTRVEWILADLGVLCAGGATSTIYTSNTAEECAYIIGDSNSRFVFAEDDTQVAKLLEIREKVPQLKAVITLDGAPGHNGFVLTISQLEEAGRAWHAANPGHYEAIAGAVQPHHLATLIYTSGTTGQPKGVELTHDNWVFEAEAMDGLGVMSPADKQFLFLPLAHSFGKVLEVAILRIGIPTAVDGRLDRVVDNLGSVQPTFVAAVPRIFEKVYNKVVSGAKESGGLKYKIFRWSMGVGRQASELRQRGEQPSGLLALKVRVAHKLVFSKLHARFGGRIRFFISGGAPLSREIAEFFHAAGLLIMEGYGLTESGAASFVNRPNGYRFGTVGLPLPGVEVKTDESDGEILLRGRGIMRGYHNLPDASAEMLTSDGWLRTGDIGSLDADGYLRITDRKKDLIKTSGGKYVAPQELENRLKTMNNLISQVLVHGNRRHFCAALITLDPDAAKHWAELHGLGAVTPAQMAEHAGVRAEIQAAVDQLNEGLPSYSTVKKFAILPADFSVESGELTASMKMKRKAVEQRYLHILDSFYEGALAEL